MLRIHDFGVIIINKTPTLRLDTRYFDLDYHLNYNVVTALTLEKMRTFLAKMKVSETHDLGSALIKVPLVGMFYKTIWIILQKPATNILVK